LNDGAVYSSWQLKTLKRKPEAQSTCRAFRIPPGTRQRRSHRHLPHLSFEIRDWGSRFEGVEIRDWGLAFKGVEIKDWGLRFKGVVIRDWGSRFLRSGIRVEGFREF